MFKSLYFVLSVFKNDNGEEVVSIANLENLSVKNLLSIGIQYLPISVFKEYPIKKGNLFKVTQLVYDNEVADFYNNSLGDNEQNKRMYRFSKHSGILGNFELSPEKTFTDRLDILTHNESFYEISFDFSVSEIHYLQLLFPKLGL